MVSPDDEAIDRMYNFRPEYGKSLNDYMEWMITTNSNYRERLQNEDQRARAIKELVSKWRKAQIDHHDYKGKNKEGEEKKPDLYREAIVIHAVDWFEPHVKKSMKELSIPIHRYTQKQLARSEAPKSKPRRKRTKEERKRKNIRKWQRKHRKD